MAQTIWTGSVGFGLVQIPVSLHAAENHDELDMTLLDKRDLSPVGYKRVNKTTEQEVEWSNIVKGYEHQKGEYVVLTPADFEAANVKATRQVDIVAFVDFSEIDPRYIERPYYLVPQKAGVKAYALLKETLGKAGKAGIGKIVLRTRQRLAAIVAHEEVLLLVLLRFQDELRDTSGLKLPNTDLEELGVTDKEVKMAEHLVQALVEPFEPEKFTDEYRRDLMKLIEQKVEAGEVNTLPEAAEKKARAPRVKSIDLAALLAKSVEGVKALAGAEPANENRTAPKASPKTATKKSSAAHKPPRKAGSARPRKTTAHKKSA